MTNKNIIALALGLASLTAGTANASPPTEGLHDTPPADIGVVIGGEQAIPLSLAISSMTNEGIVSDVAGLGDEAEELGLRDRMKARRSARKEKRKERRADRKAKRKERKVKRKERRARIIERNKDRIRKVGKVAGKVVKEAAKVAGKVVKDVIAN